MDYYRHAAKKELIMHDEKVHVHKYVDREKRLTQHDTVPYDTCVNVYNRRCRVYEMKHTP